jgi:glycosyltransferase involved in cell wall biosynthesis
MDKKQTWQEAQKWEISWWGDCANTYYEEVKQLNYAPLMGLDEYKKKDGRTYHNFDLRGKRVLDIGGGPVSLLLKCVNFSKGVVVDPGDYPQWVRDRYKLHNIKFINIPAEDIADGDFDEVWIYNVLQHTRDPEQIIKNAIKIGKIVRIFEWVNTGIHKGHIHNLTTEFLSKYFVGTSKKFKKYGLYGEAFIGIYQRPERKEIKIKDTSKKRFHLVAPAHLPTNKTRALACAYSQKVLKMAKMLKSLGHTVFFYGVEGSTVECDEFIQTSTQDILIKTYGDYDYTKIQYKHNLKDLAYQTYNENTIREINKRKQPGDFLLISMGKYQRPIANGVKIPLTVEMGIGYSGVFSKYRVFESYAWMHHVYGLMKLGKGPFCDCVIPNYFEPEDFEYRKEKDDYFLYFGRVVPIKGVKIAKAVAETLDIKLKIAGQLGTGVEYIDIDSPNIEYVGFADVEKRRKLMSGAKALFVPTLYIEPFAGVHIEAMFCGTPTISTDWGIFTESVIDGVNGYRCRTLDDFLHATENIDKINPQDCRDWAIQNYTLDRIAKMYEHYFNQLQNLEGNGWYEINRKYDKDHYKWFEKYYPKGIKHEE